MFKFYCIAGFVHIHYSLYKHVQRGGTKADCLAF